MKIFYTVTLLLFFSSVKSQNPGISIIYNFSHITDTNNLGSVHQEIMTLDFDKSSSVYYSEEKLKQEQEFQKKVQEAEKAGATNGVYKINLGVVKRTTSENIILFPKNKKIFISNQFKQNKYLIVEQIPNFSWKIKNKTRIIKGYNCQLATGYWKGRIYDAWFSTDLPYPFGPWKLNGLPGVILEASDETNTIKFECDGINTTATIAVNIPKNAILTSQKEFDRMKESMNNVGNQLNPESSGSSTMLEQVSSTGKKIDRRNSYEFNNPIELKNR